jgi:predicted AAA+ superfamily ATPase
LLPERVGAPLSLNALREDLEVAPKTIGHWMNVFEHLYFVYRIKPFASRAVRSLKKMPKAYLWDWSLVDDRGPRFENLVANHLLKLCTYLEDREGYKVGLSYLRDRNGREVDFLVTHKRKPWFAVECKLARVEVGPALRYFRDRLKIPWTYQVVLESDRDFVEEGIRCLPAHRFLAALI